MLALEYKLDKLKQNINFQRRTPGKSKPYHSISNTLKPEFLKYKPFELAEYIIHKVNSCQKQLEEFFNSITEN